jgi:capsular polysaccharide biosynthesis protein
MEYVRQLYLPEEPARGTAFRRLYVSRRDAAFRRVLNEDKLMPILRAYGFEEVVMSKLSVGEQAKVFSEAEIVMGPNGSALANLVFAHPSCHVIEFSAPGWVVGYNWMICANFGLPYTALIGQGPRPAPDVLPREIKQDILLDLDQVKGALDAFRPKPKAVPLRRARHVRR